jgi:hypothetical protein
VASFNHRTNTIITFMKIATFIIFICWNILPLSLYSQTLKPGKDWLEAVNVSMTMTKLMGKEVVKVIKDSTIEGANQPVYARINGVKFKNGTIEVKVLSRLQPNAPATARGFIGIAFRINDSNSKFEGIYIRPTNGRATDQVRRNHSIQYFSYPDYSFDRLRKEAPEKYESYADMGLNEWITLKIVVKDSEAKLFINNKKQPSLIVNDLKLGPDASGTIGLWVDIGTEGYFSDLKIQQDK